MQTTTQRPELTAGLTATEFLRWYWLLAELQAFARLLGLRASGSKALLAERIEARLAGRAFTEPPSRRSSGPQLAGQLSADTVIPPGQRCSTAVRAWFVDQLGSGFHFDGAMRDYFAQADGTQTLGDALAHWHASRPTAEQPIADQFEYNRFTRAWHAEHPAGSRDQLMAAWRDYRARPTDERGRA